MVRIEVTSSLGHASNHWLPADVPELELPAAEVVAPRSKADAVRRAVALAKEELGRPVAKPELRWWLESPSAPDVLADAIASNHLGRRLSDTGRTDQEHPGEDGRLHAVMTRFTCHGGAPVRWTVGPPTERDQTLCRLEDVAYAYRVPDELRSIPGLERRGENFRQDVLLRLARIRRRLLGSRLREAAAPFGGRELVAELEASGTILRGWAEETPTLTDDQPEHRTRELDERERLVGSLEGVLTFMAGDDMPSVHAVGEAGTASLRQLEPLLEHAIDLLGLEPHRAQGLIERVRRFPAPGEPGRERFGAADENPLSHVDRVEAIEAVYELFSVPRARSLISGRSTAAGERPARRGAASGPPGRAGFPAGLSPRGAHRRLGASRGARVI